MSFSLFKHVRDRGLGRSGDLGLRDNIYSSLYSTMTPKEVTDATPCDGLDWGAVFGFGFSPDGSLLAAACENKCMLLYDPNNARLIQRRFKTHTDCVNCVRFLDNRTFATCSDDGTVRLWDARFLSSEVRILRGHTSWVKNIEYSCSVGKLITSGFDGNIFGWDINNYTDNEKAEPLFSIKGIMRTKITPNEKKMIISTMGGYFLLIHDLELDYLKEDLSGFNPHHYWLMQLMNPPFHHPFQYSHMFTRKRNRVEFMCDFPHADDAESISTMQVHPQGWCIASRNTTVDEESEWTCVHDIQNIGNVSKIDIHRERSSSSNAAISNDIRNIDFESQMSPESSSTERNAFFLQSGDLTSGSLFGYPPEIRGLWGMRNNHNGSSLLTPAVDDSDGTSSYEFNFNSSSDDDDNDAETAETFSANISSSHNGDLLFSSDTSTEELSNSSVPNSEYSPQRHNESSLTGIALSVEEGNLSASNIPHPATTQRSAPGRLGSSLRSQASHSSSPHQNGESDNSNDGHTPRRLTFYEAMTLPRGYRVRQSVFRRNVKPRLLFYSEEPNIGRGFIKEQSFSADGRVLASPFGNCVRLLAFNSQCSELCDCVPAKSRALTQVGMTVSQKSSILASTFSPNHCMFVAGARDGSISFCSPKL